MPRIFVLSGPDVGASRDVPSGATLGRADDCTLPLHDASVSRRHARIEQRGSSWHVVDAGSRNGVFVRGERVEEAELADGEEFLLGEVLVRFRVSTDAPTAPASPSSPPVAARPIVARPPAPPVAADEIVLEGDWDESAAAAAAARAGQRLVSAESAAPARPERPVEAPSAARAKAEERLRAAGVLPKASAAGARGVLQYHKVEARPAR